MVSSNKDNTKYLSRCHYYGKLENWEYVSDAMVLLLRTYTASPYHGGSNTIRLYVPTELEQRLTNELVVGDNYYVIASPYRVSFNKIYRYRVDLLLHIFKEI